jgi:hypothetical protein
MEMIAYGICGNDVPLSITSAAIHVLFSGSISVIVVEAGVNPLVKSLSSIVTVKKWLIASELAINFDQRNFIKYVTSQASNLYANKSQRSMYKGGKNHNSLFFKCIITFEKLYETHFAEIKCCSLATWLNLSSILKMEAVCTKETPKSICWSMCCIPEGDTLFLKFSKLG